jgi:hypothetical protein
LIGEISKSNKIAWLKPLLLKNGLEGTKTCVL